MTVLLVMLVAFAGPKRVMEGVVSQSVRRFDIRQRVAYLGPWRGRLRG